MKDGAKSWPAFKRWSYKENGYKHLAQKLGQTETTVYVCPECTNNHRDFSGYSFQPKHKEVMAYEAKFLPKMAENEIGVTLREESMNFYEMIKDDIKLPDYYHTVGTFEGIEFT